MSNQKEELKQVLEVLAMESEKKNNKETAQGLKDLIAELDDGKRDATEVSVKGRVMIKKFQGQKKEDSSPVEVQEFITNI